MHQVLFPAVIESRKRPRFVMNVPMPARFANQDIFLQDISESGCRVLHALPLKIGASAILQFENPATRDNLHFEGRIVWSHLAREASTFDGQGYRSAIRFDSFDEETDAALARFVRSFAHYDPQSLSRKKETLTRKVEQRKNGVAIYRKREDVPFTVLSEIVEAREYLALNPGMASQWYQKARKSRMGTHGTETIPHRDEVVAIYELLGHKYPVTVISLVLSHPGAAGGRA